MIGADDSNTVLRCFQRAEPVVPGADHAVREKLRRVAPVAAGEIDRLVELRERPHESALLQHAGRLVLDVWLADESVENIPHDRRLHDWVSAADTCDLCAGLRVEQRLVTLDLAGVAEQAGELFDELDRDVGAHRDSDELEVMTRCDHRFVAAGVLVEHYSEPVPHRLTD